MPTPEPAAEPAAIQPSSQGQSQAQSVSGPSKALLRLKEFRRALQRQARRKLKAHEQNALERAARMLLRAEIASLDPNSDSNDVVRLDNAARRARLDYERIANISTAPKPKPARTMADIERELAHAG
jgi:hypothetical protein